MEDKERGSSLRRCRPELLTMLVGMDCGRSNSKRSFESVFCQARTDAEYTATIELSGSSWPLTAVTCGLGSVVCMYRPKPTSFPGRVSYVHLSMSSPDIERF